MKKSLFEEQQGDDGSRQQWCAFCNRHESDMPVYSVGIGRIGICMDCAEAAVKALRDHAAAQVVGGGKRQGER